MGLNAFCRLCDTWERMVATGLGDQLDVEALMAGYAASKQALMRDLEAMTAPPTDAAGREGAA